MNFRDRFLVNLEAHSSRLFVTELEPQGAKGAWPRQHQGGKLRLWIEWCRRELRSQGISAKDRVCLLAGNSAWWVAWDLALLAEGAVSVPLYARQEPSSLMTIIGDVKPKLIIGTPELLAPMKSLAPNMQMVSFDEYTVPDLAGLTPTPAVPVNDKEPITIIYTSGSSGEPKGAMLSSANIEMMLPILDRKLTDLSKKPGGEDRVFHYLPFCFAGSRMVLWGCLYRSNGISLCMDLANLAANLKSVSPHYFLNVPALLDRIRRGVEERIRGRGLWIKSIYYRALNAAIARSRDPLDVAALKVASTLIFPSIRAQLGKDLRALICGSAPLSEETQLWFELLGIPVYQVYGLTETTAIVTMDSPGNALAGWVGSPIHGCQVRISDEQELELKGENVFLGYFERPDLTREMFSNDGWLRTGDQATVDGRGRIQIIGRAKNVLVPASGHNIPPEPIEQRILEKLPYLTHAMVVGHGKPSLIALVVGDFDINQAMLDLKTVNEGLPHYQRIRQIVKCDESWTPENGLLTANQKLRRKAIESHFFAEIDRAYRDIGNRQSVLGGESGAEMRADSLA